jgi:hypothetical protein
MEKETAISNESSVAAYQPTGHFIPYNLNLQNTLPFLCDRIKTCMHDNKLPNSKGC